MSKLKQMSRSRKYELWEMCNELLNSVRKASGKKLVDPSLNPYKKELKNS